MARPKKPIKPAPSFEFSAAYPSVPIENDTEFTKVATLLPHIVDREKLQIDLLEASIWLSRSIYDQKREDPKAVQKILQNIRDVVGEARAALDSAGDEARSSLMRRAGRRQRLLRDRETDPLWARIEPDSKPDGAARLETVRTMLNDLHTWADDAARSTPVPHLFFEHEDPDDPTTRQVRKGQTRPVNSGADEIMRSLIAIWEEQVRRSPTIATYPELPRKVGLFIDFCKAVIDPVYRMHGEKPPSIQALAQKHCYPPLDE